MNRRNPEANSGCINWPQYLTNTGEGGMFVHLVFEVADNLNDSFVNCCGPHSIHVIRAEEFMGNEENENSFFPNTEEKADNYLRYLSVPLLAAICLGSSGGSWYNNETDEYWQCSEKDLTDEGKEFVRMLEKLYNRKGKFVTFLDT